MRTQQFFLNSHFVPNKEILSERRMRTQYILKKSYLMSEQIILILKIRIY